MSQSGLTEEEEVYHSSSSSSSSSSNSNSGGGLGASRLVGLLSAWLVLLWRPRSLHVKSLFNLGFCFQRRRNRFSTKQNKICLLNKKVERMLVKTKLELVLDIQEGMFRRK